MPFDPNKHFVNLSRSGPARLYLPVSARIAWFRDDHGMKGGISTEVLVLDPKPIIKATVWVEGVAIASAMASVPPTKGSETWAGREVEKAETAAIGRALAHAGYGTLNAMMEDDDIDNLADSPVPNRTEQLVSEIENERRPEYKPENVAGRAAPFKRGAADPDPTTHGSSSDTISFITRSCTVKATKNGKPFLVFANGNIKASAFTRDRLKALKLSEADLEDLAKVDTEFGFADSVMVTASKDDKGYWQVDGVTWEMPT